MKTTLSTTEAALEKLNEVKAFLHTLLDSSSDEAVDLLINYGEDIEKTLQKAINKVAKAVKLELKN